MKQLQLPRANTITNDGFTGPAGELTADNERWELRLHDNETPGGHRILNLQQLIEIFMSKDSEFGQVVFAESDRGILTRIGDRQYALRKIIGYNGIHVTEAATGDVENQDGEAADFWVGLDPDDLATLLLGLASGKLLYAGLSAGTADALTLTVPTGWKNDQGSIVAFKSHINVHDSATMQITVGATPGSVLPLMTAGGSTKVSQLLKHGVIPLLMRIDRIDTGADNSLIGDDDQILTGYRCIGFLTAKEIGIEPISGMTATNVQDALAELHAGQGGGGGATVNPNVYRRYPTPSASVAGVDISLADGEFRAVEGVLKAQPVTQCDFKINNTLVSRLVNSSGGGAGILRKHVLGIVFRNGTKAYWAELPFNNDTGSGNLDTARGTTVDYVLPTRILELGTVVDNKVRAENTQAGGGHSYSAVGIVFPL